MRIAMVDVRMRNKDPIGILNCPRGNRNGDLPLKIWRIKQLNGIGEIRIDVDRYAGNGYAKTALSEKLNQRCHGSPPLPELKSGVSAVSANSCRQLVAEISKPAKVLFLYLPNVRTSQCVAERQRMRLVGNMVRRQ